MIICYCFVYSENIIMQKQINQFRPVLSYSGTIYWFTDKLLFVFNSTLLYPSKLLTHLVTLKHFKQVCTVFFYSLKIFQALLKPTLCFDLLSLRGTYVFSLVALCKACIFQRCVRSVKSLDNMRRINTLHKA